MKKINRYLLIVLLLNISLFGSSFSKSKKILLKKIYYDNKSTFYCNNPYETRTINGKQKTLIIKDKNLFDQIDKQKEVIEIKINEFICKTK